MRSSSHLRFIFTFLIHSIAQGQTVFADKNVDINSLNSKLKILDLEKKLTKSLFLPELSLNSGIGSEKLIDKNETEKGPYLFIEGKINLYQGGRYLISEEKIQSQVAIAKIEKEIKERDLKIESFKRLTEIEKISKEILLFEDELQSNKTERSMAQKKVDAGLTTAVDLLDFELKNEMLQNEIEKDLLKKKSLEKELMTLFGGEFSYGQIAHEIAKIKNDNNHDKLIETGPNNAQLPLVALAKKQSDLVLFDKKTAKSEYLPTINLETKWGRITPQRNSNTEHQVFLNINFPLFSGFSTDNRFQQAVIESAQKERELKQAEIEIDSKRDIEIKKIILSKKILASLHRSLAQSTKYKDLTISEYKRGIKNSPDVISASDKLFEVKKQILETQNELLVSTYSYNEFFKPYNGE